MSTTSEATRVNVPPESTLPFTFGVNSCEVRSRSPILPGEEAWILSGKLEPFPAGEAERPLHGAFRAGADPTP